MRDMLLLAALAAAAAFGWVLMGELDDFLDENRRAGKKNRVKKRVDDFLPENIDIFSGVHYNVTKVFANDAPAAAKYGGLEMEERTENSGQQYDAEEHILVCISPSPSNAAIIRTAAKMARAFHGAFTALFVETPDTAAMNEEDKKRLHENIRLAQQLGADVETTHGEDISYQIAEFARLSGVTQVVVGRSMAARKSMFIKPTLTERLITAAPGLEIHVIPDSNGADNYRRLQMRLPHIIPVRDTAKSILVLLCATLIGYAFYSFGFSEANIIAVYILGVLVISTITTNWICGFVSSAVSVLIFNFFFTIPRFTFHFDDSDYIATFAIMFLVSFLTGSLAARLKDLAKQSAHTAFRTQVLLETSQLFQKATDEKATLAAAAGQISKLLNRDVVIYPANGQDLGIPQIYRTEDSAQEDLFSQEERTAALWTYRNNRHAGASTDTFPDAKCMYLAIRVNNQVYGVAGIEMGSVPIESFENSILLSILGECALALQNIKNAKEKEEAAIVAKNEQLRANLLRAISHDLRTPLTSISGSADNLLTNYEKMDDAGRVQTFRDIYDDSMWMINLVENLLAVTRFEGGQVSLNQSVELMDEVIAEALRHCSRKSQEHVIQVHASQDLILAYIDVKLVVQVLINLIDNAVKYTPAGSEIKICTEKRGKWVMVSVADNGPGVPDDQKERIFDMFYSGANKIADSRRSLGLGLSLCKSIVTAHGGTISVSDHQPSGSVFTFTLPAGEVELHE